ncbi:DNA-directed DNA polymerase [Macleaya cordata]|uniref:DNA polymerase zeta catalytic subunit n=1 Tax=Macleaya cordata TaxID=56857 RepID=A0A200QX22_MACCD|nr:DNA-directed DNA polymerase [Macleaya cordata]
MEKSQSDSKIFSVRIVSIDYYMAPPITDLDICYSSFQGGKVNEVPVIRIYGSTPAGQKTCLHVHRALPYLYVPCSDISLQTPEEGDKYIRLISSAVEKALKLKGSAGSRRQHVHGCNLVRARKFYGYHSSEELFVKIYFFATESKVHVLQGGSILDKCFPPHESHIPYLLQFLVDYNLYGMGHLHVSKMKFRHPLPEDFIRKADYHSGQYKHAAEKMTCVSADSQADPSSVACLGSPIWISSTIPSGWTWPFSVEHDDSFDRDLRLIKRQSTCELEGDATVDEILNQQLKLYSSLSQTRKEVKMVQSLIPIWEEEYERTGMHEAVISPDPSKPPPESVLQTFSHGHEFENALLHLCREAEKASSSQDTPSEEAESFIQSIKSLTDVGNLVDFGEHVLSNCPRGESLKCLEERNRNMSVLSGGSSSNQDDNDAMPSEWSHPEGALTSEMTETSDPKVIDTEALGILRWLASSQAVDDLNTDDELVHEPILSPFLPKTNIDEVLEKANLDYESESQKECQDILDSVEHITYYEDLKERAVPSIGQNPLPETSSENIIPQVDGSCDDHLVEHVGNSFEGKMTNELEGSSHQLPQDIGVGLNNTRKRTKRLWGTLPFSNERKVNDDLEFFNSTDLCNEMKNCTSSCSASGNKVDKLCGVPTINDSTPISDLKEGKDFTGSSMRDLMRRKRCSRVQPFGTSGVRRILLGNDHEETSFCPKQLDFHMVHDGEAPISENALKTSLIANRCIKKNETFGFQGRLSDIMHAGASAKPESFMLTDLPLLHTGTMEVLESFNSKKQDAAASTGPCECSKAKEEHDVCAKVATSVVYSCKHDPFVPNQVLKYDRDDKTLIYKGHEQIPVGSRGLKAFFDKNGKDDCSSVERLPGVCFDSWGNSNFVADLPLIENCVSVEHDTVTCLSKPDSSLYTSFNSERGPVEMTFSKKPPTVDGTGGISKDASFTAAVPNCTLTVDMDNDQGTLRRDSDGILPFFIDNCQEEKEVHRKSLNFHQETILGVPTHYQNDGSFLYLLTTVLSPPSVDCVEKWVSHQAQQNTTDDGPGFSADARHETVPESGFVPCAKQFLDPPRREDQENLKAETILCSPNEPYGEGSNAKEKGHMEIWQDVSQISGPDARSKLIPLSQTGFRDPASVGAGQQLTLLSIEVNAESRGDLRSDPRFDAINVIALAIQEDSNHVLESFLLLRANVGESRQRNLDGISGCKVVLVSEEKHLFNHFVKIIRSYDPDVLMGWEIQGGSLGYLAERAAHFGLGLLNNISRTPASETKTTAGNSATLEKGIPDNLIPEALMADTIVLEDAIIDDEWGRTHASGVHVGGRIVLNIWRLMQGEIKLNMYTFESVAEAVLRRKIPSIPSRILTQWFSSGPGRGRFRCIEYVLERARLNLEIINKHDLINRTSELARVFGIDFFSVLSRGSQYRVESMLMRLAHTQNYLAISPGNQQVASQPAMECLPLVMEPESGFYADPVVVLDFQSLYPSMIIAYNLCFCTCLGKIMPSKEDTLGVSKYVPDPQLLMSLKNQVMLTPNGVMYVPSKVRKGVLPRLLEEILSTRIMVKKAMKKLTPSQQVLYRIFNARQLALKLIANVTYGYTAAGFSGRMPCAELADSIVQCGRRTLETAISFVNAHAKWNARVIYGDTDSMFVLLKGRSVKEAFRIGQEIASVITSMNPNPVALKMEKVYHPCFLLTKKRYVGYSYESPDQAEPSFDAKGIETVRRDGCGAVSKTLEQSLKLFFEHQDVSKVKVYLQRQWTRILGGRVSVQDFVFAKEVRLGTYSSRASSLPPAAIVATKAMRADPRAEPRYAERIPYVVIHGEPGARLVDMVVDPLELLRIDSPFRLNDLYYISKQIIPALQRVFGLVGADLNQWFLEMPRPVRPTVTKRQNHAPNAQRNRIDYYYLSKHCVLCGEFVQASTRLCDKCSKKGPTVAAAVIGRTSKLERDIQHLAAICGHCGGGDWIVESGVKCTSLACSVFYERRKVQKELGALSTIATDAGFYPSCSVEWF